MTRADLTHLYFLLDRSGSMQSIKSDIVGGFDAFVAEQRSATGECRMTLARFDNEYELVFADVPITQVGSLVLEPRGSTALLGHERVEPAHDVGLDGLHRPAAVEEDVEVGQVGTGHVVLLGRNRMGGRGSWSVLSGPGSGVRPVSWSYLARSTPDAVTRPLSLAYGASIGVRASRGPTAFSDSPAPAPTERRLVRPVTSACAMVSSMRSVSRSAAPRSRGRASAGSELSAAVARASRIAS